jgi:hypothetical protein
MMSRVLAFCAACVLLTACDANNGRTPEVAGPDGSVVRTYTYYDANHLDGISAQPSAQAIYNISHGTWLWPPATTNDRVR